MWPEVFNLPLYAAHVSGRGRWLLRRLMTRFCLQRSSSLRSKSQTMADKKNGVET
jgi:hypothetical protein